MTSLITTVVCHTYALVWLIPHFLTAVALYLALLGEVVMLATLCGLLFSCTQVRFKTRDRFTRWLHKIFLRSFNGISVVRLDINGQTSRRTMYCFHPHAMVANGFGLGLLSIVSLGQTPATIAVARSLFWLNPVFRWLVNSHDIEMCTVSRADLHRHMQQGRTIGICPGGFEEALFMRKDCDVLFLSRRTGFVHLAIDYNYKIVPVLTFGESKIYENVVVAPDWLKAIVARCGIPLVWPRGTSSWSFNPYRPSAGLRIVFGESLSTDSETYEAVHSKYIDHISILYRRFNLYREQQLVIL